MSKDIEKELREARKIIRQLQNELDKTSAGVTAIELERLDELERTNEQLRREIRQRAETERSLRESEERFRTAFHTSPDSININRLDDGVYVNINEGFTNITGYTAQEVIGKSSLEIDIWADPADRQRLVDGLKKNGVVENLEAQFRLKDGRVVHGLMSARILMLDNVPHILSVTRNIESIKQTEQELRESEAKFRSLTEESLVGVYIIQDNLLRYVNPKLGDIFGYPPSELIDKMDPMDLIHPDDRELVRKNLDRRLSGQIKSLHYEFRGRTREGRIIHVEVFGAATVFRGRPAVIGSLLDITERKQAELKIRQNAQHLAVLFETASRVSATLSIESVCQAAVDGLLQAVSPDVAFIFLRNKQELILKAVGPAGSREWFRDIPQHRVGECMCGLAAEQNQALYSQDIFQDERCTWDECKQIGFKSFAALPLHKEREVIAVIGLASKKRRDFSQDGALLETLAHEIAGGLNNAILHEQVGHRLQELTAIHKASQQLQKVSRPEALAGQIISVLKEVLEYEYGAVLLINNNTGMLEPFAFSISGKGEGHSQADKEYIKSLRIRKGQGITGWVAEHGRSVRLGDVTRDKRYRGVRGDIRSELCVPFRAGDQIIGVLNIESLRPDAYSATDQSLLETVAAQIAVAIQNARLFEQVEQHAARLEQRVQERTAELESFTYSVSHDLRAPLRAIEGFSRFLQEEYSHRLDAEGRRYVKFIREGTLQMDQLINGLLRLSRISRSDIHPARIDMKTLVSATFEQIASAEEKSSFEFELADLPEAIADSNLIRQVWINLISNALKYSSRSETKRIEISADKGDKGPIYRIKDHGVGFDPKYKHKLFEVFQRLHGQDEFEGTGIGLAIVKRIITRHGGRIWAESEEGRGATFYFSLPATG